MSGHSKWSTIKRQKGLADAKRGATFTKISNAITIAVKQGGGVTEPDQNPRLRLAIELARANNMPKDNIERAIAKASAKGAGELTEVIYEGFASGGVSVMVEAVTDNANRTTPLIKSLFNKYGASFGGPGSVSYQFEQTGEILINKNDKSIDDIFMSAAELGANDVQDGEEEVTVYTSLADLNIVKEGLKSSGFEIIDAQITRKPTNTINVEEDMKEKIFNFLSALEDMDDVQKVYSNISLN